MKVEDLSSCLKDIILSADTPVADCNAEEGIRFLYPPPETSGEGAVFVGTLLEWKMLRSVHLIHATCTYMVCMDGEAALPAVYGKRSFIAPVVMYDY